MKWLLTLVACLLPLSTACGSSFVETEDFENPSSFRISEEAEIEDTDEHIAILQVVNQYREAMEKRDGGKLSGLVSAAYYENASSTDDVSDDYGNEKLEELFSGYLGEGVQEIRYDMEIKQLKNEAERVLVDYEYAWSFRYEVGGKDFWESERDVNRLTLVREHGDWKIEGGL